MKKQSSCPSALNREETGYSAQIGPDFFIREATLADAAIIWQTIYDNRVYLRTWLPFVDGLKEVADEEAFLNEQLALPYADRNIVFVIGQGHELCGLVGFVITDNINHRTEIFVSVVQPEMHLAMPSPAAWVLPLKALSAKGN